MAVVTGASGGIGASLTVALANSGMQVVGLARRAKAVQVSFGGLCDMMGGITKNGLNIWSEVVFEDSS